MHQKVLQCSAVHADTVSNDRSGAVIHACYLNVHVTTHVTLLEHQHTSHTALQGYQAPIQLPPTIADQVMKLQFFVGWIGMQEHITALPVSPDATNDQ